jgi:hypothetical protein
MGHATVTHLSKFVNTTLLRGPATIRQIVDGMVERKMAVHAGEGNLADPWMLAEATQQILDILMENELVQAMPKTQLQKRIFKQWYTDKMADWDCGDDGRGGDYGVLDSITWYALRRRLKIISYLSN